MTALGICTRLTVKTIASKSSQVEGKILRMFGRCDEGRGELNGPWGVASIDRVYVSELGNHCVSVFTSVCDIIWQ